jgi:hypothetical protein
MDWLTGFVIYGLPPIVLLLTCLVGLAAKFDAEGTRAGAPIDG